MKEGSDEQPWIEIHFPELKEINRMRLSSNREYYYDVDYLTTMPSMGFSDYKIDRECRRRVGGGRLPAEN